MADAPRLIAQPQQLRQTLCRFTKQHQRTLLINWLPHHVDMHHSCPTLPGDIGDLRRRVNQPDVPTQINTSASLATASAWRHAG